jgi:ankyrin repeat protein
VNHHDWTVLTFVAQTDNIELVRALVEGGANVNGSDRTDQNPLTVAVTNGHGAVVRELLRCGANVNAGERLAGLR